MAAWCWLLLSFFILCPYPDNNLFIKSGSNVDKGFYYPNRYVLSPHMEFSTSSNRQFGYVSHNVICRRSQLYSKFKIKFALVKQSKRGSTCLALPSKPFVMDLTMCMDVALNPGPEVRSKYISELQKSRSINYSKPSLFFNRPDLNNIGIPVRISRHVNQIVRPVRMRNISNCITVQTHNLLPLSRPLVEKSQIGKIKLAHLNVRSLRNRVSLMQTAEFVHQHDIAILTISETWLNSSVTNWEIDIPGYKLYRLDRKYKKGGGVCVYLRDSLKAKLLKSLSQINESGFHQLWLTVQHAKLKSIIVCVAYRPPDCQPTCFVNDLTPALTSALAVGKEIFIAGDLNCNMLSDCFESAKLREFCNTFNLTQLISQPTRVTAHSSTLLDVILTTNNDLVSKSDVIWQSI
jgi:hypothetical protein